jgi:hypothetical protein
MSIQDASPPRISAPIRERRLTTRSKTSHFGQGELPDFATLNSRTCEQGKAWVFGQASKGTLRSSFADSCKRLDLCPRLSSLTEDGDALSVHGHRRPTKPLAFRSRVPQSRLNPFLNQRPFKFGHCAYDLEHEPARRCA